MKIKFVFVLFSLGLVACSQQTPVNTLQKLPLSMRSDLLRYADWLNFDLERLTKVTKPEIKAALDPLPTIYDKFPSDSLIVQDPRFSNENLVYSKQLAGLYQAWAVLPNLNTANPSNFIPDSSRSSVGTTDQVVAVIDNGSLQIGHPDLAGKILERKNFIAEETSNPQGYEDGFGADGKQFKTCPNGKEPSNRGHGTAMASVIAARINNDTAGSDASGMIGVAPNARVRMYRVNDECLISDDLRYTGSEFLLLSDATINDAKNAKYKTTLEKLRQRAKDNIESVANAINYAVSQNVDAINMSFQAQVLNNTGLAQAIGIAPNILPIDDRPDMAKAYLVEKPCSLAAYAPLRSAIENAYNKKIPVFVAVNNLDIPAIYDDLATCPYVMSVTSVADDGVLRPYSGYGENTSIAVGTSNLLALGISVSGTGYQLKPQKVEGNSPATAVVTGTYLLMKAVASDRFKASSNIATYGFIMATTSYKEVSGNAKTFNIPPCGLYLSWGPFVGWYSYADTRVSSDSIGVKRVCGFGILNIHNAVDAVNTYSG